MYQAAFCLEPPDSIKPLIGHVINSGVSRMAYPGVQTEDGVLAPPGKLKNGAPRRRCWMGEGGSMLEVIISFSDNVIGIRLLKIALTGGNWQK